MPALAIDFGTTTTVAAVRFDDGVVRLVTIEGTPLMPSAVYLGDNGVLLVGRDAERQARLDPARFEPNPKRRIDDGEILLGPAALPVAEVIGAVLRRVLDEAVRMVGGMPTRVVLTHPARWGGARRQTLVEAARRARMGNRIQLVPEPVAAASHFADRGDTHFAPGTGVAVYDLGGGTFDAAVVRRSDSGWVVVAESGLPELGGVDFDQALLELVGEREGSRHPDQWRAMTVGSDAAGRRARRVLATDVRDAKESLSRWPQTDLPMPAPFDDVTVTRADFESLIRDRVRRTVELLATQLSDARGPSGSVAGIYLVGGSSRIPLVTQLIRELLGVSPIALGQPETVVAVGALTATSPPQPGVRSSMQPPRGPGSGAQPPTGPPSGRQPIGPTSAAQPPTRPPSGGPPPIAPAGGWGRPPRGWWSRGRILSVAAAVVVVAAASITAAALSGVERSTSNETTGPATSPGSPPAPTTSRLTTTAPSPSAASTSSAPTSARTTTGPTSTSTRSSPTRPSPTASAGPFDKYFPDPNVRAYMSSISIHIAACQAYDPKYTSTQCTLDNGLRVEISAGQKRRASAPDSTDTVGTGAATWRESRWRAGHGAGRLRTWLYNGLASRPALYWDRNGAVNGFLTAPGKDTTTTARALMTTWEKDFKR